MEVHYLFVCVGMLGMERYPGRAHAPFELPFTAEYPDGAPESWPGGGGGVRNEQVYRKRNTHFGNRNA